MCNEFNELRSEMVLLYELKNALAACEQELHSLKGQFEAACPGKVTNTYYCSAYIILLTMQYSIKLLVYFKIDLY